MYLSYGQKQSIRDALTPQPPKLQVKRFKDMTPEEQAAMRRLYDKPPVKR